MPLVLNCPIHPRLSKTRLIAFVVSVSAIADNIDYHVTLKGLTKIDRQHSHTSDRFGVIAVHMKDRRLNRFSNVGGVGPGKSIFRISGKANLIVDNNVDCPTSSITTQMCKIQRFTHNSLTSKRSISMQ